MTKIFKGIVLLFLVLIAVRCSNEIDQVYQKEQGEENASDVIIPEVYDVTNFYKAPDSIKTVTFIGASSAELNSFINSNKKEGAIITITKGNYNWNTIKMKSNVYLQIEEGTVIKPESASTKKIFDFGGNGSKNGRIENVSLVGLGAGFVIDISSSDFTNKNITIAKIGRVDNFNLSNFKIVDRRSSVASIVLAYLGGTTEIKPWASNGVIQNISQTNAHTGYGLIQAYSGDNILFKSIACEGGVTLRFETDDRTMKSEIKNGAKEGGVKNIFAYDIKCTNGITPLMFSPHFTQNGKVTIDKVVAIGCAFAVRVEHGFVELFDNYKKFGTGDPKNGLKFSNFVQSQFDLPEGVKATAANAYKRNNGTQWAVRLSGAAINAPRNTYVEKQLGILKAGKFEISNINDISAIYKNDNGAKIKQAYLKYLPASEWSKVKNPTTSLGMFNGFEYHGPSLSLSIDNTNGTTEDGNYIIKLNDQKFIGFPDSYIQNITNDTPAKCDDKPSTIVEYDASF